MSVVSRSPPRLASGSRAGGSLKHDTSWGMRKLAYEIRQRTEADYRFFRFETDGALLDELEPQPADRRRRAALPDLQGRPALTGDRSAAADAAPAVALPRGPRRGDGPPARPRRRPSPRGRDAGPRREEEALPPPRRPGSSRRRGAPRRSGRAAAEPAPADTSEAATPRPRPRLPRARPRPRSSPTPARPARLRIPAPSRPEPRHPAISAICPPGGARTRRSRP